MVLTRHEDMIMARTFNLFKGKRCRNLQICYRLNAFAVDVYLDELFDNH